MINTDSYRDNLSTVDQSGNRVWIYPKKPKGKFYSRRKIVSYIFLALLFLGPFIKIRGNPILLLNILERKFVIFGYVFWPQDLHIFAIGMVIMILFISLFSVIYGRVFCGWVCPQTVFMELIFRRIEYYIEGDYIEQQRLNKSAWNTDKFLKRILKHLSFGGVSFLISNTFLSYIIGYEILFEIIFDNPLNHLIGLSALLVFSSLFYFVYAFMREQICTVVCPYGRFQGILLDERSLTVSYDYVRGENRSKLRKEENRKESNKGDCIDCFNCVRVCPTGIDIRNGTQLECINCTACMDACDSVMEKLNLKKGLVRLCSQNEIDSKSKFRFTPRVVAYTTLLIILAGIMTTMIISRTDLDSSIIRTRGTLFQKLDSSTYSNIYDINLINKTNNKVSYELKVLGKSGLIKMIGDNTQIQPQQHSKSKFLILLNEDEITSRKMVIYVGIYIDGELIEEEETSFIAPTI